jgi:hypothetical protein
VTTGTPCTTDEDEFSPWTYTSGTRSNFRITAMYQIVRWYYDEQMGEMVYGRIYQRPL